ncbi:MAG: oxidoreductase [Betaproteobacteria bacterium]|nr:oxidoreductase [Betaproteobacteria bacterium]
MPELELLVRQIRLEARNIHSYELVHPRGEELPGFEAGAHIDVQVAEGLVRQYSLSNPPGERHRYVIGVLRDEQGRGGSRALHDSWRVGARVRVSEPRNHFALRPGARRVLLLAGGIGVTPLKAMAHQLHARGADYELHYCARDEHSVAFADELRAGLAPARVHLHLDGGDPSRGLDISALLARERREGTQLYYCGPAGFMRACAAAAEAWPAGSVHCEHFKAPDKPAAAAGAPAAGGFTLQIASSGLRLQVPAQRSVVEVLREAGIEVPTSCEAGLCATCKTGYLQGEVDHQDCILGPEEQRTHFTPCVSRARSELLVLDL